MVMKCEKCGAEIVDEAYEYAGQKLCEDCYLDLMATPKVCDPWAVHSAKSMSKDKISLTPIQQKILDLIREKGPITAEQICNELNITENEFKTNFASLRHMELAKATKIKDKICYVLFNK